MRIQNALPAAVIAGALLGLLVAASAGAAEDPVENNDATAIDDRDVTRGIPLANNEPVRRMVAIYSGAHAHTFAAYLERSGRYEEMIRGKLRERGMPEDLLYLSLVESGFNPTARSPMEAVGLWQFIAETGERYGLRIDGYVDERRDPERSTDAALSYLSDLYDRFGSWYLAAAAYNAGENRIGRLMVQMTGSERGWDADFWRIRPYLPRETQVYVPALVAATMIGSEPQLYGVQTGDRWPVPHTETVPVPGGTSLALVAASAGVSEAVIQELNPALLAAVTPPGEPTDVRIPESRAGLYAMSRLRPSG